MLHYVILTIHSSHLYLMWNFTHTCNLTIPPHMWVSASLWGSRPLYQPWTSPTHSPLPNGLFISSMHHPWVSRTPSMGTTCRPRMHIHGNLAPHHYLAPLAIFLCWAFLFFLFFLGSLFVGHLDFLCPRWVGTINTSPPSSHITTFAAHHHGLWYHLLGR